MRLACLLLLGLVLTAAPQAADRLPRSSQAACEPTPRQDWLPKVIAPSSGERPIWFVDGGGGIWHGADYPIKSVWILDRATSGALRVSGRETQKNRAVTFRRVTDGPRAPSLLIEAPFAESMTPGGASVETMRKFAFVSSELFYPSPGCWELDAQLGEQRVKVVVEVRQQ